METSQRQAKQFDVPRLTLGSWEAYEQQEPIRLSGRVAWQLRGGQNYRCGVEYDQVIGADRESMQKRFAHFRNNSEF